MERATSSKGDVLARRAEYLGPEKRRPLVLDAAEQIFADGGFADASMQAIADRAEVSKAVLYDCFPGGKQEIYFQMLARLGEGFTTSMLEILERTNKMPLKDGIKTFITEFHDWVDNNQEGFKILFGDGGTSDPEVASKTSEARVRFVEKISERTKQVMESGGLEFTPVNQVHGLAILTMAEATARWRLRDPSIPKKELISLTTLLLMKGFAGISPGTSWQESVDQLEPLS